MVIVPGVIVIQVASSTLPQLLSKPVSISANTGLIWGFEKISVLASEMFALIT